MSLERFGVRAQVVARKCVPVNRYQPSLDAGGVLLRRPLLGAPLFQRRLRLLLLSLLRLLGALRHRFIVGVRVGVAAGAATVTPNSERVRFAQSAFLTRS